MAKLPNYRIGLLTTAIAFLFTATAAAQQPLAESSVAVVPSNALAFIHVDVVGLSKTSGLEVPAEILSGVTKEIDDLVLNHLGMKPSELTDAAYVMPSPEALMELQGGSEPVGFGIFRFSQPVDFDLVQSRLPQEWRPTKIGSLRMFVNRETKVTLFHNSANTLVLGTEDGVRWFIKYRGNLADNEFRNTMKMTESGHLTIGINGDSIPAEVKAFAPPEFKALVNAKTAAISFDLTKGVVANARIEFNDKSSAEKGLEFTKLNLEKLKALMTFAEADASQQLNTYSSDLAIASQQLGVLAMVRYGTKIVNRIQLEQKDTSLVASAKLDFDAHLAAIVCLSAIQAVGTSAEAEFKDIAQALDASSFDAEAGFNDLAKELQAANIDAE